MSGRNGNQDRTVIRVRSREDLIEQVMQFDSFRIRERIYSAEMLIPQLVIDNKDLLTEGAVCAAFVMAWGREAARARRWHAQVEATYRGWRDRTWLELKQTPLAEGKLPTDKHTEMLVHMHPEYGEWRGKMDDSQEAAENAEAVYEALKIKAILIKSQQRLIHDEAGGPYHVAEEPRQTVARRPQTS